MDLKIRRILNFKNKSTRSNSNIRLRSLPKLKQTISKSNLLVPNTQIRSSSASKPIVQRNESLEEESKRYSEADGKGKAKLVSIEDELAKLNILTQKNNAIRGDWLNIQQQMIELNTSSFISMKENLFHYKPLNIEHIIQKCASNRVLKLVSSRENINALKKFSLPHSKGSLSKIV